MYILTPTTSDITENIDELACFLEVCTADINLPVIYNLENQYDVQQYCYALPLGRLRLLNIDLYLPVGVNQAAIEIARKSAIKSALEWQKLCSLQNNEGNTALYYVLTIDIQQKSTVNIKNKNAQKACSVAHSFGAWYFMEEPILDISETSSILQIFSWQDWQASLATVKTPSELWRFLSYHSAQLQRSSSSGKLSFDSEKCY